MSTFANFKQSLENLPSGLLSIEEVEINFANKLTSTSYSKLVSFLNLFERIKDLRICRDHDLHEPAESTPLMNDRGNKLKFEGGCKLCHRPIWAGKFTESLVSQILLTYVAMLCSYIW